LNSNGSTLDNPGSASRDGLIRDHHGDWLKDMLDLLVSLKACLDREGRRRSGGE